VKNGRATGVALENGDEYHADLVVSGLDPKRTFLKLVEERELPGDFVANIRRFKTRGSSGKVNLALSELPRLSCMEPENIKRWGGVPIPPKRYLRGAISISPTMDYVERAYDDAKHGSFSKRPYMDVVIPSMIDPDMAPPGQHVMSIFCQYAPFAIDGGWDDAQREAFGDAVVDALAVHAPNIKSAIIARQVLTPADIERITGLTEGNIFQGELALDQLFFLRPAPGYAKYRTPVEGFYQCGSGTHPGGGIMGASGRLAALTILGERS
jgi:phytoene dehydrogenase-like protein